MNESIVSSNESSRFVLEASNLVASDVRIQFLIFNVVCFTADQVEVGREFISTAFFNNIPRVPVFCKCTNMAVLVLLVFN